MHFHQIQASLARLRFKDESALRTVGLAKLAKAYDAYPIAEDDLKLIFLLPRGLTPLAAGRLDARLARQIIVLAESPNGPRKIWPHDQPPPGPAVTPVADDESPDGIEIVEE